MVKLIYRGKYMQKEEKLNDYGIKKNDVIEMVQRVK